MYLTPEQSLRENGLEAGREAALKSSPEHTLLFKLGLGGFGARREV